MANERDDELSAELRQELRSLAEGPEAPAGLEETTARALRERGLLQAANTSQKSRNRWLMAAAACVLFLGTGFFLGQRSARMPQEPAGNQFVLFLNRLDNSIELDPTQEAQLVNEYSLWAHQQRTAGHLLEGEKLNDDSVVLNGADGRAEKRSGGELTGGFFVIVAQNLDDAVAIARTCPHLRHGGSIVIRPIDRTP